ncbi:mitochondrial amidoxime reducing component 2-like [Pyxicephalus adspersus]|uniref:mitochondrial amidoxime reducing component 2-like n=1 Tax=Pyxicephalus adspersus TaxID=30357 RepID=UPI003B5AED38
MEVLWKHRSFLIGLAGLGAAVAVTWIYVSRRKEKQMRKVGKISQLFLYPIKSCKGIPLQRAECREYGLKNGEFSDRHWLVVKEDKVHVTARQEPRMVLITVTCDRGQITLSAPGMEKLAVPLKLPTSNAIFTCKVHGNDVSGRDCGDEASQWITNFLKNVQTYRLVQFEDRMKRRNPKNEYPLYSENDRVAYPDLSPLLLVSEASLEDLNSKLENKVSIRNFRPNIVVSGCGAFAEDTWKEIQIGESVTLQRVMPCPRSVKIQTVLKGPYYFHAFHPPLPSYRLCDTEDKKVYKSSPLFGQFVRIKKKGMIKVGDPVYEIFY